jgi:UDP-N-acetylmuramoylalanine--D-glutamate ligase
VTPATTFSGKTVALFGLGGSGLATAKALVAGGATVHCWDDGEAGRAKAVAKGLTVTDLKLSDSCLRAYRSRILSRIGR